MPEDYWGNHRPGGPSDEDEATAAPAHALDRVFPSDVYTHPHYYGGGEGLHGGPKAFRETVNTLRGIRGKPDAPVTIYRALPKEHADKGFRTGDWVSVHPKYAEGHGLHHDDPSQDMPVIKATVPAKHLWNDGNSLDEFGYHGPPIPHEGFSKEAGLADDYRVEREAQDRRFEQWARGGVGAHDTNSPEYHEYFGKGEHEGAGVERRHTFKNWLTDRKAPEEGGAHERAYWEGHEMGSRHGEDPQHADFDEMEQRADSHPHSNHFFKGYTDGFQGMSHTWDKASSRIAVLVSDSPMRITAHVSGNQIDILHCPFCGSGAVIGRSDGTIECGFCTSVFTVQSQPQYTGMPQSVDGQPYQWPGQPDPAGVAAPDMPEGTNLNPNTNGEMDPAMGGDPSMAGGAGFQSSDPADDTGDDEDPDADGDDDDDKPAFLKGKGDSKSDSKKDKKKGDNPFAKKKSYRTATGGELDEADYLAHLAIQFANDKARVAKLVKDARKG